LNLYVWVSGFFNNGLQLFIFWDNWLVQKMNSTSFTQFLKNGNH